MKRNVSLVLVVCVASMMGTGCGETTDLGGESAIVAIGATEADASDDAAPDAEADVDAGEDASAEPEPEPGDAAPTFDDVSAPLLDGGSPVDDAGVDAGAGDGGADEAGETLDAATSD